MEHQITCINCPVGCRMTVTVEDGKVTSVTGNTCKRGVAYAEQECVAPQRMVTAVVTVAGRKTPVSVKTRTPIPKVKIFECMKQLAATEITAVAKAEIAVGDDIAIAKGAVVAAAKAAAVIIFIRLRQHAYGIGRNTQQAQYKSCCKQ